VASPEFENKELGIKSRMGGKPVNKIHKDNAAEFGTFGGRKSRDGFGEGLEISTDENHKVSSPTAKQYSNLGTTKPDLGPYDITPGEKGERNEREADEDSKGWAAETKKKSYAAGDEFETHRRMWGELGGIDPAGKEFGRQALNTADHATGARDLSLADKGEKLVKGGVARRGPPRMDQLKGMGAGRAAGAGRDKRGSVPMSDAKKFANPGQIKGGKI
jgi:hypothetical protein